VADRQQELHRVLHERANAIADAWYRAIRASSPTSLSPAEVRQLVDDLTLQVTGFLVAEDCDQERIDSLAMQLLSLRLPPRVLGTLQEVLVQELVEGVSGAEMAPLRTLPGRLVGNLTASLLHGCRAVVLEGQERIRRAYVEVLRQVQRELRSRDAVLRQQVERLQVLQQIDRGILAARSAHEIGEAALRHLRKVVPCRRASVTLFDLKSAHVQILAAVPPEAFDPARAEASFQLTGWEEVADALRRDEVHLIDDIRRLPLPPSMRELIEPRAAHTHAVVPLRYEGELLGSLNLALEESEDLTSQHQSMAWEVANSLAVAIRHAQLDASNTRHREQLRALTARLAEQDEAKRRTLARDLHDQIGQRLTALGINLNVIKAGLNVERAPQLCSRLDDSLTLLNATTDRVRRVMADLRPPMLDDYGLLPTLHWCGEQLASRTGIDVVVEGREPDPRLPSSIEDALVRIAQEALTNVAKHALASRVIVALSQEGDRIRLTVSDDGAGFEPDTMNRSGSPHWGLVTMTERAEAAGGRCRIEAAPGEGTRVVVEVTR
jgi:signal transduction histidine kinase